MKKISEKEWLEDFQDFVKNDGVPVPDSITASIFAYVHSDLNPSPWIIFLKLFGIHSVVGTLSLGICNQFGLSPFQTGFSLSDYFMTFGHSTCMFLCGVIFAGLTVSASQILLRREEIKVLRKNVALEIFGLSAISLGVFAALGAEIALTIGMLWFVGSMIGGVSLVILPQRLQKIA